MRTNHDDLPHPVPPIAYLRWKENYFFVVICPEQNVFGICHLNNEPAFNRSRFTLNLSIQGKRYSYASEREFPQEFAMSKELSDGTLTVTIHRSDSHFGVASTSNDMSVDLQLKSRLPSFDFGACKYGAPDMYSFKEASTYGTNLPFEHIQQAMTVEGRITPGSSEAIRVRGYGYRDHSWGMRCDNRIAWHTWSALNFSDRAFGIMTLQSLGRQGITAKEGYVVDASGARVLKSIEVKPIGEKKDSLPEKVVYEVVDVYGQSYMLEADVSERLGQVALVPEKAPATGGYQVTENFCRIRQHGSSEPGLGLVELGYSPSRRELTEKC